MKQPAKSTPFVYLCPQCGELLYYRLRARDTHYGAPLRPCPHCGATYFDPSYREPALEKRPRLPLLPGTVWGGLLLGLAFLRAAKPSPALPRAVPLFLNLPAQLLHLAVQQPQGRQVGQRQQTVAQLGRRPGPAQGQAGP